ncbi:uncharacterized protein LOC127243154 [Andrographis paniculata]|uniref:uncharacterized protein LOC127243154 n=1 Tax=Andrographis paniculata TaxID=175694 RepID=UPI0021E9786C|nr:uncharacterized protein LOC127243154 [Andrographis paniculata]
MDSGAIKSAKALPTPLLLKDFLLEDLSSCSSGGFESYPRRRHCTTTVRFLIEIDLKNTQQQQQKNRYLNFNKTTPPRLLKSPSKSALAAFYTFITAVKRFQCSATPPENKMLKKSSSLRRSLCLSMKLIEKSSSFWKRKPNHKGIEQWKSFEQLLKEDSEPPAISSSLTTAAEFAAPGEFPGGNFSSGVESTLTYTENDVVEMPANDDVSADSIATNETANYTKKDQFSPVSVLNCPFEDEHEEEEVASPFQHNFTNAEGTRKQQTEGIHKPEIHFQLEPVNLAERFSLFPDSDNESSLLETTWAKEEDEEEEEERRVQDKALHLLNHMKDTTPSYGIKARADKLLLDFFTEQIMFRKCGGYSFDEDVLEEAESWIIGRECRELFLEWNVASRREVYVKDMEKGGEWRSMVRENEEMAFELEGEVLATLLNELLVDHMSFLEEQCE